MMCENNDTTGKSFGQLEKQMWMLSTGRHAASLYSNIQERNDYDIILAGNKQMWMGVRGLHPATLCQIFLDEMLVI